ncbi:hypothetical protein V8F33_005892 [Rhypophila sp. PSN 637]
MASKGSIVVCLALLAQVCLVAAIINCTENSLRIPSWIVYDLSYDLGDGNIASFQLSNRVTSYTSKVNCQVRGRATECQPETRDASLSVRATFDDRSASLSINQSWTCDDKKWNDTVPVKLNFTATGTSIIPATCLDKTCHPLQNLTLIRASLLSPISETPRYLSKLPFNAVPNCQTPLVVKEPLWRASKITYTDRDIFCLNLGPAPISCRPNGIENDLDLFNAVTNSTTHCTGMQGSPPGLLYCEGGTVQLPKYAVRTYFLVRNETGTVDVEQVWKCDNDCYANDTSVSASAVSITPLPPFALEEPNRDYMGAMGGMCLLRHLRTTGWDLSYLGIRINTTAPGEGPATEAEVGFFAQSRYLSAGDGNRRRVPLLPGTNHTDGTKWINCYSPEEMATAGHPCRFKLDSATGLFTLTRYTKCDDIDRTHPYLFTITASYTVTPSRMDCEWKDYRPEAERGTYTRCEWSADPRYDEMMVVGSLADITWEPMPASGFSPNIWDGRVASAFPWWEPGK